MHKLLYKNTIKSTVYMYVIVEKCVQIQYEVAKKYLVLVLVITKIPRCDR